MSRSLVRCVGNLRILTERHPVIRSLGEAGFRPGLHGGRVWKSTFWLMDYLAGDPVAPGERVIEIGCGWGLLGIYCAKAFKSRVLSTDADADVFPYLDAHARLNGVSVETEQVRFEAMTDSHLARCDVLLGADICFWPGLESQLRRLVRRSSEIGVGRIILADPGRATFMRMAESCVEGLGARLIEWRSATRAGSAGYLLVLDRRRR